MKKKTKAIFIISYKRSKKIPTIKSLKDAGSKLPIYIIIGSDDPEKEEYLKNYDNVVVFDKAEIRQHVDCMDNFEIKGTPLYARKFCYIFARENNISQFVMLDDDYTSFLVRYDYQGVLKNKKWNDIDVDIDSIFESFFKFKHPRISLAFSQNGDYIGGVGARVLKQGFLFKIMNCFFCTVDNEIPFRGTFNDDVNASLTYSFKGIIPITTPGFSLQQGETQSNSGGLTESYLDYGTYVKSFYSVILYPSSVNIWFMSGGTEEHKGHPRLHHKINSVTTFPKIIHEKYKKGE